MQTEPRRVILLIADISGYTKFITSKRKSLAHAQAIITELLKSIISEIKIPLQVVEIEGDAVFFYGAEAPGLYIWEQILSTVSGKLPRFFDAFHSRLKELERSNMCRCNACHGVSALKLKMIVHSGEALFYKIGGFSKLSGPDVILAHRLLKNPIKATEYLLMTEQAFSEISKYQDFNVDVKAEEYEELGKINLHVHYPTVALSKEIAEEEQFKISFYEKMKQTLSIGVNGMLITFGLRNLPPFRNLTT